MSMWASFTLAIGQRGPQSWNTDWKKMEWRGEVLKSASLDLFWCTVIETNIVCLLSHMQATYAY